MSCIDCNSSTNTSLSASWFPNNPCASTDCGGTSISALCVIYNGSNLSCSGINTGDSLEEALQKIDEQICAVVGDYSEYNMNCLPAWWETSITTQAEFVDAITSYACTIRTDLDTFINTTYTDNQSGIEDRFTDIEIPGITCASASVSSSDGLNTILAKYCTKFGSIDTALDISSVDWNNCLSVVGTPSTLTEGFQLLADQICTVYSMVNSGSILPIFNNYSTCIGGTSSDTLVDTIGLIIDRLCNTSVFDIDSITWGCISSQTTLQSTVQELVTQVGTLISNDLSFSEDFILTPNDVENSCAGYTVTLATPLNQDRFVASNAIDSSPGTLIDKLTAGANISIDDTTTPGQIIVAVTGLSPNYQVKADAAGAAGYLTGKMNGQANNTGSITITTSYNAISDKVDVTPTINRTLLFNELLDLIDDDSALRAKLCEKVSLCPCLCDTESCLSYLVQNESVNSVDITYVDCRSGSSITFSLPASGSITVCAKAGSVSCPTYDPVLTILGSCAGGSTSTSTTTSAP